MNKYSRLGKNTLLVFMGSAGSKLISLLMLPFYTRWLSVEDYGTTDIINVYVSLLMGLVTACIADAIFIFPKDQPTEKQKSYFSSGLLFAIFSFTITAILFKTVKIIFLYQESSNSFTRNTWLIYGLLATNFLQQYIQQFVRSIDKIRIYATTGIVVTTSTAICSFLVIPKWGVFGYVMALIISNLAGTMYSFFCSSAYRFLDLKVAKKDICVEMLKYSIPIMPNSIMWWLIGSLNRLMMEKYLGIREVGIFAVANKFPNILTILFSIFLVSWQISVLDEFGKEGYDYFFNRIFRFVTAGLFVFYFVISIGSEFIINIFTTIDFYEASQYVPLLTLGCVFSCISGLVGSNFSAARKSKYFFYSSIWGAGVSIVCNYLLIRNMGTIGAAITMPVSFVAIAFSRIIYSWKYVKINNITYYLFIMFIGILLAIALLFLTNTLKYLVISILFVLFIYLNRTLIKDVMKVYQSIKSRKVNNEIR
jgi:O-antigen/teichoic acid export membrane protein